MDKIEYVVKDFPLFVPVQGDNTLDKHPLKIEVVKNNITKSKEDKTTSSSSSSSSLSKTKATKTGFEKVDIDPLSAMSMVSAIEDPLSSMNLNQSGINNSSISNPLLDKSKSKGLNSDQSARQLELEGEKAKIRVTFKDFKQNLLENYAFSGNVTVGKGVIAEIDGTGLEDGSSDKVVDKYEQRLQILQAESDARASRGGKGNDIVELSREQYENHVDHLKSRLDDAWAKDERVLSLKLAIQMAKLLGDTSVPKFYPTVFVLVTDVLEDFGEKVYKRLLKKCNDTLDSATPLSAAFVHSDVPFNAREITRNWFYKIACIRELIPRLYVEMSILKCYRFLVNSKEYAEILSRMASIMRGIGDPLIAAYARCYLFYIGSDLLSRNEYSPAPAFMLSAIQDACTMQSKQRSEAKQIQLEQNMDPASSAHTQIVTMAQYSKLLSPAIQWTLRCIALSATKDIFQYTVRAYSQRCGSALVLKHIIESFDGALYSYGALGLATLCQEAYTHETSVGLLQLYSSMGQKLTLHAPPIETKMELLNTIWKSVMKTTNFDLVDGDGASSKEAWAEDGSRLKSRGKIRQLFEDYVLCVSVWLEVCHRHYSGKEMTVIVKDLILRLTKFEEKQQALEEAGLERTPLSDNGLRMIEQIIATLFTLPSASSDKVTSDESRERLLSTVLQSDHILKLVDMFKGQKRVHVCQQILIAMKKVPATGDPILLSVLFEIGRTVHDSVDELSPEGEKKYCSSLICGLLDKVDFGSDFEMQLNTFVDCRATFSRLDAVKDRLVILVCSLALRTNAIVKGKHSRRTTSFAKACIAFCHVTIPSVRSELRRLELMLHCAQVALQCQCLPQTDTLLKAAISLFPKVPAHEIHPDSGQKIPSTDRLLEFIKELLSLLVLVPGHPHHGPFYIVTGLFNALPMYAWPEASNARLKVYTELLVLLCTYAQKKFPYSLRNVQSNDVLFQGNEDYHEELKQKTEECMEAILTQLTQLGELASRTSSAKALQARGCLDLIQILCVRMENTPSMNKFIFKLINLAKKHTSTFTRADKRLFDSVMQLAAASTKLTEQ